MMSERIAILLRHGDYRQLPNTPSAHQPFPLTQKGKEQASEAAPLISDMLSKNHWSLQSPVYCSTMLRAWQTAKIISEQLHPGLEIEQTDLLAERGLGSAANLSLEQIDQIIAEDPRQAPLPEDWKSNSHFRLPLAGAESLMMAGRRVANFVSSSLEKTLDPNDPSPAYLFVGHGAAFRHAAHHLGVLEFDEIARLSMFHARPVALKQTSSGEWVQADGHWKTRPLRETGMD